jgi:hypothetical protein
MTKSSLESAFEDEDFLLDPRVWVAVYNKQNDHGWHYEKVLFKCNHWKIYRVS